MSQDDIQSFADKRSPESKAAAEQRMKDYKEGKAKSMGQFNANMQKISEAHDAKMGKTRAELQDDLKKYGITPRPGYDPKGPNLPDSTAAPNPSTTRAKYADKGGSGGGAGTPKVGAKRTPEFKKGGKVSSASKRADGCAIRGKTRA